MVRFITVWLLRGFLFVALGAGPLVACARASGEGPITITAEAVPLSSEDPDVQSLGSLTWLGGLSLSADARPFGGFSGLQVSDDGRHLLAITDQGRWLEARLVYDDAGYLSGLDQGRMGRIAGLEGEALSGKSRSDAEALTRLADGSLVVGFERNHRVWRYPPGPATLSRPAEAYPALPGLATAPRNKGLEALVVLPEDRLLAFTEGHWRGEDLIAYLWDGKTWETLTYAAQDDYRPTAAARLPDGDILLLERHFTPLTGVSARLRRIPGDTVEPGARLQGRLLAALKSPLAVDNLEGLAVRQSEAGETLIYLLSDDNFNILQRTLLLHFRLNEPAEG